MGAIIVTTINNIHKMRSLWGVLDAFWEHLGAVSWINLDSKWVLRAGWKSLLATRDGQKNTCLEQVQKSLYVVIYVVVLQCKSFFSFFKYEPYCSISISVSMANDESFLTVSYYPDKTSSFIQKLFPLNYEACFMLHILHAFACGNPPHVKMLITFTHRVQGSGSSCDDFYHQCANEELQPNHPLIMHMDISMEPLSTWFSAHTHTMMLLPLVP